jgi:ELWxxDGT repeat protein
MRFPYCDGDFIFYNNNLYFRACGEGTGEELFVFDGVNPPELVADLNTRTNDSYPNNLFVFQDRLFFSSDMGPNCFWSYDGSGSPALVGDENLKLGGIAYFTVLKDTLYFCAFDDDEEGVWRYDGSTTPEMLTNLNADSNSIGMVGLTTFREKLYYWRLWIENPQYDPLLHTELCTYDRKNPPTILLEFAPDYSPRPDWEWSEFIEYQGKLFFSYVDSVNGAELWQLDGDNPPALVADINPGIGSSNPGNFGIYDNKLCFSADDGEHGPLLWVYDGVNPPSLTGEHGGYPQYLTEFKGKLYYSSLIGGYPYKLTVYDGHLAPYIFNFAGNACNPTDLMVFHNRLYFWADNGKTEYERGLWVYDGIDQARMIAKVPGSRYNPNALTPYKDILYFRGEDVFHGSELWKYNCIPTSATLEPLACNIYRSPSGYYSWTESGSYADTLTNCLGCDSLLTIDLEIFYGTVNTAVSLEGTTLTAEEEGAEYQWLDCDRAYAMLYSETEQSFTPDESGSYAVIVTDEEGCTDTSSCYMVEVPDELTDPLAGKLRIYPNPFNDQIIIEFSELPVGRTSIEILDITGKVMFTDNMECTEASHTVNLSAMEGGIYFVRISNEGFTVSKKVVKVD